MKVVAFVPIRLNSKRIKGKNLILLGGKPLLTYIFEALLKVERIDEVYAYCSSEDIVPELPKGTIFLKRDTKLDGDLTKGGEIYEAFCNSVEADVYILAHTTSPFTKTSSIESAVEHVVGGGYDSALAVQKIQTFTWYKGQPLNYSLDDVPRTQDLEPILVETSAFFAFKKEVWKEGKRRVGEKPFFVEVDNIEGIDIDNPEDLEIAERLMATPNR
ncbi:acylneuraminate cytidylyltransferase family protein [uncultured Imperialibacter sp.]|uniref:acylneuraminate cytidylyltransferase family protein n=1 Tax=uncultured Imperialibacter sp. TaxID=1672639 RepID=UPI0030DB0814|tara:strand:+ start:10836 stop:11483 length:648 start_codon:yes stop_codon:yes gene_type:complete